MSKAKLGAGNVDIDLLGETLTLKPNLKAALAISRQAGGVRSAIEAVGDFNIDVIVSVIGLGLGLEGNELKALPQKVFDTGLGTLVGPLTKYLVIIANGGHPTTEEDGGEGDEDPQD
jgi:hypothetical protein